MNRPVRNLVLLLTLSIASVNVSAAKKPGCDPDLRSSPALTLPQIKERSVERTREIEKTTPAPKFDNIEEQARTEQVGEVGPQAFQEMLPYGVSFVQTPGPTSVDPVAVDLVDEGRSLMVHVDVPWDGRRTSTAAFLSLPRPKVNSPSKFLVGPDYPVVLVHLHGGGTPTATGRNAWSIAREVGKRGIPVVGIDLPGHGRATRNPDGLETFKKQADWLMKVVKQLIDPKVKIVLSGHSWGGSFALFMHRLSQDPNYSRIAQYISLSPPIDVSLGGSLKDKLDFEQRYQAEFEKFKDKIAPTDFEFQSNLLNNGKASDVGAFFTNLTDLDYHTPPLTPEEQARLKKLTVIVGSADGLVYVGREEQFEKALGNLQAPNRFILMGPGQTWKSKGPDDKKPTGHGGIFDRYIDGTTTPEAYQMIADAILEGQPNIDATETTGNPNMDLIDRSFRHYANFFGFREMLRGRVEFVQTDTEHRPTISKRRGELEEYLRRVTAAEEEVQRVSEGKQPNPAVQKAIDDLRGRLGITENINAKRAEEELATPKLTPERKALLEAYIAEVKKADEELSKGHVDTDYNDDIKNLNQQFKSLLAELGIADVTQYKTKYDEYNAGKKEQNADRTRIRAELGRLHQRISELNKKRENRFGLKRDAKLAGIRAPSGVRDSKAAKRELALDQSEARRKKLRDFIAEYAVVEADARQKAIDEAKAKVLAQNRPPGVNSPADAQAQKAQQEALLNFTYAPQGNLEIQTLAKKIGELSAEVDALEDGDESTLSLDKLEASVKSLRVKRASMLKQWEGLWTTGKLSSPLAAKHERNMLSTLANYKELYFAYENKKSDFLLMLKETGQLYGRNILAMTPEIKALRRKVQHARQVFLDSRLELESVRWTEAINGQLQGPADIAERARSLALEVWGVEYPRTGKPSANSITQNLKVETEYLATRQAQAAEAELELNELRVQYSQKMAALNIALPFRVQRVELGRIFDQPLASLVNELNARPVTAAALSQMLAKWESYLAILRTASQSKDKDNAIN